MENKEQKYYEDKSTLTGLLSDFIKLCKELGRDVDDEIEDIIVDAKL